MGAGTPDTNRLCGKSSTSDAIRRVLGVRRKGGSTGPCCTGVEKSSQNEPFAILHEPFAILPQVTRRVVRRGQKAGSPDGTSPALVDEPSYAVHPDSPSEFVNLFNTTVEGVEARIGLHLCFGNFVGRPVARRTYRPLFPGILDVRANELALEFANRELAELDLGRQIAGAGKTLAAGLVDVKNYYVESAEDVADRIGLALVHVQPEMLSIVPDCGFSQTARWASKAKLRAMVDGAKLARQRLG